MRSTIQTMVRTDAIGVRAFGDRLLKAIGHEADLTRETDAPPPDDPAGPGPKASGGFCALGDRFGHVDPVQGAHKV